MICPKRDFQNYFQNVNIRAANRSIPALHPPVTEIFYAAPFNSPRFGIHSAP